jgi:hypothetical protein
MQTGEGSRPWIERLVASQSVRASYASLLAHVLALLVLAMLITVPRPVARPPLIRLAFATETTAVGLDEGIELGGGGQQVDPDADAATEPATGQESTPPQLAPVAGAREPATAEATPSKPTAAEADALPVVDAAGEPVGQLPDRSTDQPAAAAAAGRLATESPPAEQRANRHVAAKAEGGDQSLAPGDRATPGAPYAGRLGPARGEGVSRRGGNAASEAAVARGLEWLARHQAADGSWRFNLSGCQCDGACRQPGTVTSTTAATGIALLPFLGGGHTHEAGEHRETVTRGLYYLMSRMQATPRGGDLSEGTMYGHGVASLALAEALGMTGDRMLVPYVRDAVRFAETAQDMHGGGWRYLPGQAGDTTVTAWQLAALKSAALAGVAVPSPTIDGICRFLDRVQVRDGEGYGYLSPQDRSCTSAIGLLCRIYTAWPERARIDRGLARLAGKGPDREAVYQNFYLSQALLLREHPAWSRWNRLNRDQLVARQAGFGHEAGSWSFADPDTAPGGRLGHTALAILTLEVYYRLLPIYSADAAEMRW